MRSVSRRRDSAAEGAGVTQAGLSLVLLVGAGLFAKSLSKLEHIDLKLDPVNRYIVHINPQTAGYSQRQVGELYRAIEDRFHSLPGVEKVGITSFTPMEDNNNGWGVQIQGRPNRASEKPPGSRRMPIILIQWELALSWAVAFGPTILPIRTTSPWSTRNLFVNYSSREKIRSGSISVSAAMRKLPATGKLLVWSKTPLTRAPPGKTT